MHVDAEAQLRNLFEQDPRYRAEYELFISSTTTRASPEPGGCCANTA